MFLRQFLEAPDRSRNDAIEVNDEKNADIVFTQGKIATTGNGFDELNGPYDAKVIGDFTGLTPPPGKHDKD